MCECDKPVPAPLLRRRRPVLHRSIWLVAGTPSIIYEEKGAVSGYLPLKQDDHHQTALHLPVLDGDPPGYIPGAPRAERVCRSAGEGPKGCITDSVWRFLFEKLGRDLAASFPMRDMAGFEPDEVRVALSRGVFRELPLTSVPCK